MDVPGEDAVWMCQMRVCVDVPGKDAVWMCQVRMLCGCAR